jgi:hypothetical protein
VLVEVVPDPDGGVRRGVGRAAWDGLSGGRTALFDTYENDQIALIIEHTRRTVALSGTQVERPRAAEGR